MECITKKTCMPVIAGILSIIAGLVILVALFIFAIAPTLFPVEVDSFASVNLSFDFLFLVGPCLIVAGLAITGGILAIRRERWGWALAGSIAAALNPLPLGLLAIILLILSKKEFD